MFLHFSSFFEKRAKMSTRRIPSEIFGLSEFFYRMFVEKKFRVPGPEKSTFLDFFQKSILGILSSGKNRVFCVVDFFEKSRKRGFTRVLVHSYSCLLPTRKGLLSFFHFDSDWLCIRETIRLWLSVFILSEHGIKFFISLKLNMTKNIKCVRLGILENQNFQTRIKFESENVIS